MSQIAFALLESAANALSSADSRAYFSRAIARAEVLPVRSAIQGIALAALRKDLVAAKAAEAAEWRRAEAAKFATRRAAWKSQSPRWTIGSAVGEKNYRSANGRSVISKKDKRVAQAAQRDRILSHL